VIGQARERLDERKDQGARLLTIRGSAIVARALIGTARPSRYPTTANQGASRRGRPTEADTFVLGSTHRTAASLDLIHRSKMACPPREISSVWVIN
jgi:hypothetical protein